MAAVQVTVHNNSDQKVTLTLDDEIDAEQIAYFQTLKRRDDIRDVQVKAVEEKASRAPRKSSGGTSDAG